VTPLSDELWLPPSSSPIRRCSLWTRWRPSLMSS